MKDFFEGLFEYNNHCNQKLSEVLKNSDKIPEKSLKLFSHIINAHEIWNSRIRAKKIVTGVWEPRKIENLITIDSLNFQSSLKILSDYDLEMLIWYNNSKGEKFSNTVKDILFHVINHSTYHRAQIATEFRLNDEEPLNTDYIFYKRT